ncbi:hypothetical protein B7463_g4527, partial [Scytalidium lignicola]
MGNRGPSAGSTVPTPEVSPGYNNDNIEYSHRNNRTRREDIFWPELPNVGLGCCEKCNSMTGTAEGLAALLSDDGYKHLNWYNIQQTAALGCPLCKNIWDATENQDWSYDDGSVTHDEIVILANVTHLPASAETLRSWHPMKDIHLHSLEVYIPSENRPTHPPYPKGDEEVFGLVTYEADPASSFVPARRESKELTPKVVDGICRWLDDCRSKHLSCPRAHTPKLPQRVIDVGHSPIQLRQSLINERAEYAALSYCWGKSVQPITTTSNLLRHMHALPSSLPKTVLDAIEVCQKINIRYLWVDSLCIVQDDESDKLNQIANMGSIYKNSTVTIVAASAVDATDGFLSDVESREPMAQLPFFC